MHNDLQQNALDDSTAYPPAGLWAKLLQKLTGSNLLGRMFSRFIPKVQQANQPDMPTITTDNIWFMRESRFLFFTRRGPVEVTLKPSFMLGGILVMMAGITTIFYSTLIASYSAIEVMRDETIQTAQASVNGANTDKTGRKNTGRLNTDWLDSGLIKAPATNIIKQPTKPAKPIISRITSQPEIRGPQTPSTQPQQYSPINPQINASNAMPMIIQGGKRVTLATEKSKNNEPAPLINAPLIGGAVAGGPLIDGPGGKTVIAAPLEPVNADTPNLAERARKFALAMVPGFTKKPSIITSGNDAENAIDGDTGPDIEQFAPNLTSNKSGLPENDTAINSDDADLDDPRTGSSVAAAPLSPLGDGLTTGYFANRSGPTIPMVSNAARAKKLEHSVHQEINYIRASITGLGVSPDVLPNPQKMPESISDTGPDSAENDAATFKDLMITLAEHRSALRKIPFKPPMLYFYISSNYGKRKHPKTKKITFHHGIDLAGTWQENVRSTAPGTVIYAGVEGSFGKVVRVQHDFDIVTTYAHLARITVKKGDYVGENNVIGKMGNTGKSAGAHLHYEIRVKGKSINPDRFMTIGRQISVAGELRHSNFGE